MSEDQPPLLDEWRQGDLALAPIELPAVVLDDGELAWVAIDAPHGVAIISQSCDIVRDVEIRPYVHIAGLVPASDAEMARAIRRETPSRIPLTTLVNKNLLIDLDAIATVHKSVVANWERTAGCEDDKEARLVATALARHRQRFAFPDAFNALVMPIKRWVESKRSKASPHGNFVRAAFEFRVLCDNWDAPKSLTFLAIVDQLPPPEEMKQWEEAAKALQEKATHPEYPPAEFRITTYESLSAREYLESDRLDWDGLSDA